MSLTPPCKNHCLLSLNPTPASCMEKGRSYLSNPHFCLWLTTSLSAQSLDVLDNSLHQSCSMFLITPCCPHLKARRALLHFLTGDKDCSLQNVGSRWTYTVLWQPCLVYPLFLLVVHNNYLLDSIVYWCTTNFSLLNSYGQPQYIFVSYTSISMSPWELQALKSCLVICFIRFMVCLFAF